MDWGSAWGTDWGANADTALVAATVAAALALAMPAVLARVPEPPDDPEDEVDADPGDAAREPAPVFPTFAEVAAAPGLGLWFAVVSGLLGAVVGAYAGWSWPLLWLVYLVPVGVTLATVDWRTMLLPTRLIYPSYVVVGALMVVATLAEGDTADLRRAGWGFLVAGFVYWLLWRIQSRWMGFGDVRLSGLLGAVLGWAGWPETAVGLYLPFLLGGVIAGLLMLLRVIDRKAYPFGPFMLAGALLGLLIGPAVMPNLGA